MADYSVVVKRNNGGVLTAEAVSGDVPRDEFTRVKSGLTFQKAQELTLKLLTDFNARGKIWQLYEQGDRALPTVAEAEIIHRNQSEDSTYAKHLSNYLANRETGLQRQPRVITVCQTPNALKSVGVTADKITINPSIIDKCMEKHGLTSDFLKTLSQELRNPAIIMKSATRDDSLVIVTGATDFNGDRVIVSLANDNRGNYSVCAVSSAYGKERFDNFINNNLDKILAFNKEKTNDFLHSTTLLRTEESARGGRRLGAEVIRYDNSITYSLKSVKGFGENNQKIRGNYAQSVAKRLNPRYEVKQWEKLSLSEILSRFDNVKELKGGQLTANCPCCNDAKNHLYIKHDEQKNSLLLNCKRGCHVSDIVAAVGLEMQDLFLSNERNQGSQVAAKPLTPPKIDVEKAKEKQPESPIVNWRNYNYNDQNGRKLYQKSVAVREDGSKFATWKRFDASGKLLKGFDGAKPPLFQQQNLRDDKIYIVEGEKDVNTMTRLGFAAVCSPHGSNWDARFAPLFEGKEVVIITDNDPPGANYGAEIENSLREFARSAKIIPAAEIAKAAGYELKKGGDISDLAEVVGEGRIRGLVETQGERFPMDGVSLSDIDVEYEPDELEEEIDLEKKRKKSA